MARKFNDTVVKGFIINVNDIEAAPVPFDCTISYTRVINDKTAKAVKEALQIPLDDNSFVIAIKELINEKIKPIKYNESKIADYCTWMCSDEETANSKCKDNQTVKAIHWFEYDCAFWAYDEIDDVYVTDYCHDESPMNLTKINMRAFMTNSAHGLTGYKVLAIHNCVKKEVTRYCVIDNSELDKCIEK